MESGIPPPKASAGGGNSPANMAALQVRILPSTPCSTLKAQKMKKALAIALSLLTFNASAQLEKSAYEMFSVRQNMMTNTSTITIRSVDNVREACEAESRKRGNNGFGFALNACAFWEDKKCTIIVGPKVNNDILGHEVRHCFQGNFH